MLRSMLRIMQAVNRGYPLVVFWIYVAMFVVAFALIFIFPPGALFMVFLGLGGLLVAIVVGHLLRLIESLLAKSV